MEGLAPRRGADLLLEPCRVPLFILLQVPEDGGWGDVGEPSSCLLSGSGVWVGRVGGPGPCRTNSKCLYTPRPRATIHIL